MSNEKLRNNYSELFKRNNNIISTDLQNKLENLKVLIAGCGSVGGAFIEGASRVGVQHFRLTEPDTYEIHNLNRQFVYPKDVKKNKAIVHKERLQQLFEGCDYSVEVETNGIDSQNIDRLINGVDLIFDGVDVTTVNGISAKLLLHQEAHAKKIPVISSLDLGFRQWIRFYDYRKMELPLDGRLEGARQCQNPIKALIKGFCTLDELSLEIIQELIKILTQPETSACQLASCCHLLAAFTGPILIRFSEDKNLPALITFDLMRALESAVERKQVEANRLALMHELEEILNRLD